MDLPFPTDPQDFGDDERISFSKLDNRFVAVHDDGSEFEFDAEGKQWLPIEEPLPDFSQWGGSASTPVGEEDAEKKRKLDGENASEVTA